MKQDKSLCSSVTGPGYCGTQSGNLLNYTHRQRPGRNSSYSKNPRGDNWEDCISARLWNKYWSISQSCRHPLVGEEKKIGNREKYKGEKTTCTCNISEVPDRSRWKWRVFCRTNTTMTNAVCPKVIYFKAHVCVSVRVFPTRSISSEMSGRTGLGGDRRLSGTSAPGNEGLWRRRAEERNQERKNSSGSRKRREGLDLFCYRLLTPSVTLTLISHTTPPPLLHSDIYFWVLSIPFSLISYFQTWTPENVIKTGSGHFPEFDFHIWRMQLEIVRVVYSSRKMSSKGLLETRHISICT